jgi:hypothetical protein
MFDFSRNFAVTTTPFAYPDFLNKCKTPFECKCQIGSVTFQFFVDANEILIMVDDVATLSNPPIARVGKKKLEDAPLDKAPIDETPLDINVSQRSPREEEPSRRMVCTRVDRSAWDCRLFFNPYALSIYLEFVPTYGAAPERFEECQCEDDDVRFHYRTWVLGDGHYRWLRGLINPLSMEHRAEYVARTIRRILDFLQL